MKALGTLNFRALCQEYGISAKTGYKWRERFLRQGLEGMGEESRRPRRSPKQMSESQVCEMVKLKLAHQYWGPRKIRTLYHRRHGQAPSERVACVKFSKKKSEKMCRIRFGFFEKRTIAFRLA